ncbi:MAG: hypothetical protein IIZ67_04605 [Bacilli bacterium]|nr:hypothetical protein [Bacilli bacterium]
MKKIRLTQAELSRLTEYPNVVLSTESKVYYYKRNILLKKLYLTDDQTINRKVFTLESINDSELVDFEELVIPDKIAVAGGKNIGFTIKEVKGITLQELLNSNIPSSDKINLLRRVGEVLRKIESCDQEFYFNDLQGYNIIVDKNGELRFIDLDSSSVKKDDAVQSYYLNTDRKVVNMNKYRFNAHGIPYPDTNNDLLSYSTMILNTIADFKTGRLSISDYYNYLSYLDDIGFDDELLDIFVNLYSEKENVNPVDYLDTLKGKDLEKAKYIRYKALKK